MPDGEKREIDRELRALLVCPVCRGELEDRPDALVCSADRLAFPVVDGVPYLILETAHKLGDA